MSFNIPTFDLKNPEKIYNNILKQPIRLSYFYIYLIWPFKRYRFFPILKKYSNII